MTKDSNCLLFRCDQCGEAFARLDNLLRHSARHKHGKIFGCEICHDVYPYIFKANGRKYSLIDIKVPKSADYMML